MKSRNALILSLSFPAYLVSVAATLLAFPSGPPPEVTGGFGELTCAQSGCHSDYELNAGRAAGLGDLVISGFPEAYEPGESYPVQLEITHEEGRGHWGFQLATRVSGSGAQAGELQPADENSQLFPEKGIQYIEHTEEGMYSNVFSFTWVAPASPVGEVTVNASGNAADGDISPDGDYIYSTSLTVPQAGQ